MQLNPAYFANKLQAHLTDRGIDSTIEDASACLVAVDGKTYEPMADETPSRLAGRIYLDHVTGAEELRAVVAWLDYHSETFNDRFTAEQLIRLWRHGQLNDDRIAEFADTWTEAQISAALGAGWDAPPTSPTGQICVIVDARDASVDLIWDFPTGDDASSTDVPRIIDVIIGGRFRPTRATWHKLIDAGLPMCSWQEASESWDQEAAK